MHVMVDKKQYFCFAMDESKTLYPIALVPDETSFAEKLDLALVEIVVMRKLYYPLVREDAKNKTNLKNYMKIHVKVELYADLHVDLE